MTKLPPTFDILTNVVGPVSNNTMEFVLNNLDNPDGDINDLNGKWTIEYITPFDDTHKVVLDDGYPTTNDISNKTWIFSRDGDYRITATVIDQTGLETTASVDRSFAYDCGAATTTVKGVNYLEWE